MLGIAEDALRGDRFKDALPAMFNELEAILTDVVVGGTSRLGVETSAPRSARETSRAATWGATTR